MKKAEVKHFGNGNFKRMKASCGVPADAMNDSVDCTAVTCTTCIVELLKRQNNPVKNSPKWEARLKYLRELENEYRPIS